MPTSLLFVLGGIAGVVGPMMMERVARQIPGGQLLLRAEWRRRRGPPKHALQVRRRPSSPISGGPRLIAEPV